MRFLQNNCCLVLLRYTDSDCPFGIFKLFLILDKIYKQTQIYVNIFEIDIFWTLLEGFDYDFPDTSIQ
jgi:hypothetical protein